MRCCEITVKHPRPLLVLEGQKELNPPSFQVVAVKAIMCTVLFVLVTLVSHDLTQLAGVTVLRYDVLLWLLLVSDEGLLCPRNVRMIQKRMLISYAVDVFSDMCELLKNVTDFDHPQPAFLMVGHGLRNIVIFAFFDR